MKYVGENALKKWTSLVKSDIKKKLDKNQGTANSGKILGVDASGEVAPTDTEVATLVDVPNGIVKGDGSTLSAAVAGTDYMVPPTGGTTGQVLTKTADGQEWQDREKDLFVVNMTAESLDSIVSSDKTFDEVHAAYLAGKTVIARLDINGMYSVFSLSFCNGRNAIIFSTGSGSSGEIDSIIMTPEKSTLAIFQVQSYITASGLLKGDGDGGVSAATAGTDYMVPPTGGTAGQVLTKTADGQEWQDREKDIFWATYEKTSAVEMTAAFLSGKMVVANKTNGFAYVYHAVGSGNTAKCFVIDLTLDSDNQLLAANQRYVTSSGWWSPTSMYFTPDIHASDHATGGSDPITPASIGAATMTEVNSAIQSAIQNTWEASY